MDVSAIVTEFGAYYQQRGQNLQSLRNMIMAKSGTELFFERRVLTDTDVLELSPTNMGPVLQAFQKAFTAYGDVTFEGIKVILDHLKVDISEYPDILESTWAGFLSNGDDLNRKNWPFIKWLIEVYVIPKMREDWELNGIFKGVAGATTPGTANPVITAVDGLNKQKKVAIGAGDCTPIAVGAVPSDPADFVDYVEAFMDGIPEKYISWLQPVLMSPALARRFRKGMKKKYNTNYKQNDPTLIDDYEIPIVGVNSQIGSNVIWTTTKGNALMGVRYPGNESVFKIEEAKREVSLMTDFKKKVTVARWDYFFTNDVDVS